MDEQNVTTSTLSGQQIRICYRGYSMEIFKRNNYATRTSRSILLQHRSQDYIEILMGDAQTLWGEDEYVNDPSRLCFCRCSLTSKQRCTDVCIHSYSMNGCQVPIFLKIWSLTCNPESRKSVLIKPRILTIFLTFYGLRTFIDERADRIS